MQRVHKRLILIGIVFAIVGVAFATFAPGMFAGLYGSLGSGEQLITYPLALVTSIGAQVLAPFGATLTAIGFALHVVARDKSR